jgi:hypothetical protein
VLHGKWFTEGSPGGDFGEGESASVEELSLAGGEVLREDVLALVGEVVLRVVDAGAGDVGGCVAGGVQDL